MVPGLIKFREYFKDFADKYVLIGGCACDIVLNEINEEFRATKDFDVVLLIENIDNVFVRTFCAFIEEGEYENRIKSSKKPQFYRFDKPKAKGFPYMVELLAKRPGYLQNIDTIVGPIHISDDVVSLSAILLEDDYYNLIKTEKLIIDGIPVLSMQSLMILKIKAWLDLNERKTQGEAIQDRDINKHKRDIIRIGTFIDPKNTQIEVKLNASIIADIKLFLDWIDYSDRDLSSIQSTNPAVTRVTIEEVLTQIKIWI